MIASVHIFLILLCEGTEDKQNTSFGNLKPIIHLILFDFFKIQNPIYQTIVIFHYQGMFLSKLTHTWQNEWHAKDRHKAISKHFTY